MIVTYHGIARDHKEWATFLGVSEQTMRWRLKHWSVIRAVTTFKGAKRAKHRVRVLTMADKARALRSYIDNESEDDIAADLGIDRGTLPRYLQEWGVKRKGKAPERVTAPGARVRVTPRRIHVTIVGVA